MWNQNEKNFYVFGHRGVKALYPENTMLSFQKAYEMGVDGIEFDVRATKDGELILMHDETVDRTTDGSGLVRDFTFAELRKLDAGVRFGEEFKGNRVPSLTELFDSVKGTSLLLNVEIKNYEFDVVDKTIDLLFKYGFDERFVITCFDAKITTYTHEKYGVKVQGFPDSYMKNFEESARRHFYSVGIAMKNLTKELCDSYKKAGIDPWCWSPDDEDGVRHMIECGSTLATCNNPLPALKIRGEINK